MELLVTAPIRIDFSLNISQKAYKTNEFYDYLEEVNNSKISNENIDNLIIYKKKKITHSSYDDKAKSNLCIFGININNSANTTLKNINDDFISKHFKNIEKFEIKVFDNTVAIIDMRVQLTNLQNYSDFTKDCEAKIMLLITEILKTVSSSINNLLLSLKKLDKYQIIKKGDYDDFLDFYKEDLNLSIMWASCAIRYQENDTEHIDLIDYWLKEVESSKEITFIKNNDNAYSLKWLKYVFREKNKEIEDLWETMFLAQYIYSVIDIIVHNLKLIINESYKVNKNDKEIAKNLFKKNKIILINQQIESISAIAYLHITEYKDIKKFIPKSQLHSFNKILEAWIFDDLAQNTEELLSTAKNRAELIYNKISTKNNFYTDVLLTFIGFFAIIDLVLSFSQYSREYTADAMISSRGDGEQSFLYYLSSIPIDTFIGSGFLLSVFLLVIYFIYRQKILP